MEIRRAAVIGAGVMGSGIAAHIANAGVPVLLLDIVPEDAEDRNALARCRRADAHRRAGAVHDPGCLQAGNPGQPAG